MNRSLCAFVFVLITAYASAVPPGIVSTSPAVGATDVDPSITEITVTFDQDMAGGFSWTGGGEHYPKTTGKPAWKDKRTCALPVALEAARMYRVGINSTSFGNFRSEAGESAAPRAIYFTTKGASPETQALMHPPKAVTLDPPNGATYVDPAKGKISITFDQKMGGGMSWTGGGPTFPESAGKIEWSADQKTCTMPVKLKPGQEYEIGINSPSHRNFTNTAGVAVEPVLWTFKTK
jgi:hypothetical protein